MRSAILAVALCIGLGAGEMWAQAIGLAIVILVIITDKKGAIEI